MEATQPAIEQREVSQPVTTTGALRQAAGDGALALLRGEITFTEANLRMKRLKAATKELNAKLKAATAGKR